MFEHRSSLSVRLWGSWDGRTPRWQRGTSTSPRRSNVILRDALEVSSGRRGHLQRSPLGTVLVEKILKREPSWHRGSCCRNPGRRDLQSFVLVHPVT